VKAAGLKDPIGTRVQIKDWYEKDARIIGVVKDYHLGSLKEIIKPEILGINDGTQGTMLIKFDKQRQMQVLAELEKIYKRAIPGSAYSYTFWDELNAKDYQQETKWQQIVYVATLLSIFICCIGLFGLTHLATHLRIKEIGIRKVLGASAAGIVVLFSRDFLKLVIFAILIASPIAGWAMSQWLQQFAYRVGLSFWTFLFAAAISIFIAFITLSFQAIQAAKANPVNSLRSD
jgi:putative ABC transport system permease protein